jgi:hypothetical protein
LVEIDIVSARLNTTLGKILDDFTNSLDDRRVLTTLFRFSPSSLASLVLDKFAGGVDLSLEQFT